MARAKRQRVVAVYVRVSTEEQAESGLGLADQQQRAEALVMALGLSDGMPVEMFSDAGYSGSSTRRPALEALRARVRRREVAVVAVLKLDRLTRSLRDLLELVEELDRAGASLVSVCERVDTGSPAGRLMLSVLGAVAEWEREAIAERTRAACRVKRAQGKAHGWAPLGARAVDGRLERDEAEAEAVALIRRRAAEGASLRTIAAELAEGGHHTKRGGRWHASTVRAVLERQWTPD